MSSYQIQNFNQQQNLQSSIATARLNQGVVILKIKSVSLCSNRYAGATIKLTKTNAFADILVAIIDGARELVSQIK